MNAPASQASEHIPVLLYHSIAAEPAESIAPFSLDPDEFARHLDAIESSGRRAVDFSELARLLGDGDDLSNLVCVTFDDGWRDNIAACAAMSARSLPATVYVTSDFLGRDGMLSETELLELAAIAGTEIGAHSVGHPRLDEIPRESMIAEITQSKQRLEATLDREVASFAYPHGAYDAHVRKAVIDAGFSSAAAVKNALSHPSDDRFGVARWTVMRHHDAAEIEAVLAGRGAPIAWPGQRLRTRGYRAVRRLRHRLAARREGTPA
ncbi:MAG: polysaccharide deacetylase family protein [Solirubrobacterales bacterium]